MKLFTSLLVIFSASAAVIKADDASKPTIPTFELTTDSNNLELFVENIYKEGTKLTIERFTDPVRSTIIGAPARKADFVKYQHFFCREMPVMPRETHPKVWGGKVRNVRWGVLREGGVEGDDAEA